MWFTSCASFDIWPLAWAAMAPLMIASESATTTRRAFLIAWLGGTIANLGGFYWISVLLVRFAYMPYPLAALLCLLLAAYQGVVFGFALATARVVRRSVPLPMALVAPLTMVAFEYLMPMIFPFQVAITQAWQTHVVQIADLTGALGVTALLLMINGALYDLWISGRKATRSGAIAVAVLGAALLYGHVRIRQIDRARAAAPQLRIGLVQPNVGFDSKGIDRPHLADDQLDALQNVSRRLAEDGVDLIVWPETSYPFPLPRTLRRDLAENHPVRIRRGFDVPIVLGALTVDEGPRQPGSRRTRPFNTALMFDRGGEVVGWYDKMYLLWFGEYTPLRDRFTFIDRWMPENSGQLTPGQRVTSFPFRSRDGQTFRLGPMICYEDILEWFGRRLAAHRPHLLVNITNDAWFGATSEPWQHLALAVYRTVELRVDMVRAVNTGVSAFIDANGRVFHRSYSIDPAVTPRPADSIIGSVAMREGGHTVFARVGNLFAQVCTLSVAALALLARSRRRRPAESGP